MRSGGTGDPKVSWDVPVTKDDLEPEVQSLVTGSERFREGAEVKTLFQLHPSLIAESDWLHPLQCQHTFHHPSDRPAPERVLAEHLPEQQQRLQQAHCRYMAAV